MEQKNLLPKPVKEATENLLNESRYFRILKKGRDLFHSIQFWRKRNTETKNFERFVQHSEIEELHHVIHTMRSFAAKMSTWTDYKESTTLATLTCTDCRKLMQHILHLREGQLYCCLKVLFEERKKEKVATWARSEPFDQRPLEMGSENAHLVSENTVWCSLLGRDDSLTNWGKGVPYRCFSSGDLHEGNNRRHFRCSRMNWDRYYRSTMVFPLCYYNDPEQYPVAYMGFLAFDSPYPNVFSYAPNIFDFRGDESHLWSEYHRLLADTIPFHIGAVLSDTLSVFLRGPYEKYADL